MMQESNKENDIPSLFDDILSTRDSLFKPHPDPTTVTNRPTQNKSNVDASVPSKLLESNVTSLSQFASSNDVFVNLNPDEFKVKSSWDIPSHEISLSKNSNDSWNSNLIHGLGDSGGNMEIGDKNGEPESQREVFNLPFSPFAKKIGAVENGTKPGMIDYKISDKKDESNQKSDIREEKVESLKIGENQSSCSASNSCKSGSAPYLSSLSSLSTAQSTSASNSSLKSSLKSVNESRLQSSSSSSSMTSSNVVPKQTAHSTVTKFNAIPTPTSTSRSSILHAKKVGNIK
ncbi:hypothetical protein BKA69DRAFT_1075653 [Paraphysoderma sedebokerense]|nr:hypothetical protein BKA69DRAFT_1075653 [Paraphysoderma sedebokerense]